MTVTIPAATMPTSDEVYEQSKLKWQKLKITEAGDLDDYVIAAAAYIVQTTGRVWSDWPAVGSFTGSESLTGTPELIPLAIYAHRMRVEQVVQQAQPGYAETAADDLIQSMSVGSYSETRRDTASLRGGRSAQKALINPHPGLNAMLEALMTEERFEFWLWRLGGVAPPMFQVEEVDWSLVGKSAFFPSADGSGGGGYAANPFAPTTMWS
jgi:hypothetical protein